MKKLFKYIIPGVHDGVEIFERIISIKGNWQVRAKCTKCGKTDWITSLNSILRGITCCKPCGNIEGSQRRRIFKNPGFYGDIYIFEIINTPHKKTAYQGRARCPKCNRTDWMVDVSAAKHKKLTHCHKCKYTVQKEKSQRKLPIPAVYCGINVLERLHHNGHIQYVRAECPICHRTDWITGLSPIMTGATTRCAICAKVIRTGKNEKKLLDRIEILENIKILRDIKVLQYYVDGYCLKTNTVYEIYEKYHDNQVIRDLIREEAICRELNCDFIIIYDRTH